MPEGIPYRAPMISIALLTKNGGPRLRECLQAISAQKADFPFEILAIDSGSTDGTTDALASTPGLTLVRIAPQDFQHGRSRNLAMRLAKGARVLFLTQDAVPADESWLANWVAFMDAHPQVAGAFGHQVPHLDADPLEALEVTLHFGSFGGGDCIFRPPGPELESAHWSQRSRSHFFSNVNSCINRWAWDQVPFPEIDFGEDQAWACQAQKSGLLTAYARHAVVRHSHDYGPVELFRRRYDEARFMRRYFGYRLVPTWGEAMQQARAHAAMFRQELASRRDMSGVAKAYRSARRAWASALGRYAGTAWGHSNGLAHRALSLTESRARS